MTHRTDSTHRTHSSHRAHRANWDDFRFALAVARSGSVSGAARALGVNHATVLRRVAALEQSLGLELFEKSVRGYEIAPEKLRLIEAVREVETAVGSVERLARAGEAPLAGVIRVTSTDSLCHTVLPSLLARLTAREPELSFELLSSHAATPPHVDLSRLHADVIVRPAYKLPAELRGEVAAQMGFGIFAASKDVPADHWLGCVGHIARALPVQKLREELERRQVHVTAAADSFLTLRSLAETGLGRVMLPIYLGQASDRLVPVPPVIDVPSMPIYVASHADLADAPRLRQARARIAQALGAEERLFLGEPVA